MITTIFGTVDRIGNQAGRERAIRYSEMGTTICGAAVRCDARKVCNRAWLVGVTIWRVRCRKWDGGVRYAVEGVTWNYAGDMKY